MCVCVSGSVLSVRVPARTGLPNRLEDIIANFHDLLEELSAAQRQASLKQIQLTRAMDANNILRKQLEAHGIEPLAPAEGSDTPSTTGSGARYSSTFLDSPHMTSLAKGHSVAGSAPSLYEAKKPSRRPG